MHCQLTMSGMIFSLHYPTLNETFVLNYYLQEDSHIAELNYNGDNKLALFGVFDGHGGKEVAHFTKQHLGECIRISDNYKARKYDEALRDSFLRID